MAVAIRLFRKIPLDARRYRHGHRQTSFFEDPGERVEAMAG
jgi:hypothetical protein